MKEPVSFRHSGNFGDLISSIPSMRTFYENTGRKVILYMWLDRKAFYYQGAAHPVKDEGGNMVMLNQYMFDMARPLLMAQDFIEDVKVWDGEEIKVNLDRIREQFVNMPNGSISRWYFYVFPDLAFDLSRVWLDVPDTDKDLAKGKIIINRTVRYNNEMASYHFLRSHEENILFAGAPEEYQKFCDSFALKVPRLEVDNFLELAQAIKQSKFFIGNQSMCFQLAEGMKKPRIVELCAAAPNVIPIGENAFDFYTQIGLEYYFKKLNK